MKQKELILDNDYWDEKTLNNRISDFVKHKRYAAGSPDVEEIKQYADSFPVVDDTVIVLGMTPELRLLATNVFKNVTTIDKNQKAIELYRNWLPDANRKREIIIEEEWLDLSSFIEESVSAVIGDGVFGNLTNIKEHVKLLKQIAKVLSPGGHFVTRMAMIPKNFNPEHNTQEALIKRFRSGEIDEAEFGFGVRLLGHYYSCYNPITYILDNRKLFNECETNFKAGELTEREYSYIQRYYFSGENCIITQSLWEELLINCGFTFQIKPCYGKEWYSYYTIYLCKNMNRH